MTKKDIPRKENDDEGEKCGALPFNGSQASRHFLLLTRHEPIPREIYLTQTGPAHSFGKSQLERNFLLRTGTVLYWLLTYVARTM